MMVAKISGYAFLVCIFNLSCQHADAMQLRKGKAVEKRKLEDLAAVHKQAKSKKNEKRVVFSDSVILPVPQEIIVQRRPNVSDEKLAELREQAKRAGKASWGNVVLFSPDLPLNVREAIIEDMKVQLVTREQWDRMVASDEEHTGEQRPSRIKPGYKCMMPEDAI